MKFIDCSACIGLDTVNRLIINHEDYPVIEKVKQAEFAKDLLEEMDFAGIDEARTQIETGKCKKLFQHENLDDFLVRNGYV